MKITPSTPIVPDCELGLFRLLNNKFIHETAIHESTLNNRFSVKVFIEKKMLIISLFDSKMQNDISIAEKRGNIGTLLCNNYNRISSLTEKVIKKSLNTLMNKVLRDIRLDENSDLNFLINKIHKVQKEGRIKDLCNEEFIGSALEALERVEEVIDAEKKLMELIDNDREIAVIFNKTIMV